MIIYRNNIKTLYYILNSTNYEMPISSLFRYVVTYNLDVLQQENIKIQNELKIPDEWNVYNKSKQDLLNKYGISSMANFDTLSDENKTSLNSEVHTLNTKYMEIISKVNKINSEKKSFMMEEVDLPLKTIPADKIPSIAATHDNHWAIWNVLKLIAVDA